MEDDLRELCKGYVQGKTKLAQLKAGLSELLNLADGDDMLEFCHTVIEGLSEEKGH